MHMLRAIAIFSLFFIPSAFAMGPYEEKALQPNRFIIIKIDKKPLPSQFFNDIDLQKTSVQLIENNQNTISHKNFKRALDLLAKEAELYSVIAGVRIQSVLPLDHQDAQNIITLANKSAILSHQFNLKALNDWGPILKAEQSNPLLLTSIYGPAAILQIQQKPALSRLLVTTAPIVQWAAPPVAMKTQSTRLFWQTLSKIKTAPDNNHLWVLLSPEKGPAPEVAFVQASLSSASSPIILMGGANTTGFVPINQNALTLNVWRTVDGKIKPFNFERNSPQKFYLALGMNAAAYDILSTLIKRLQGLEKAKASSSIEDIDKNAFWWDLTQTTLIDGDKLYLPRPDITTGPSQTNILLFDPSQKALNKWLAAINCSFKDVGHLRQLGIFDYSSHENIAFYKIIVPIVHYTKNIQVAYNSMTEENMNSFLSQALSVDQIDLGRKASRLLLKIDEKQSTCVELKTNPEENEILQRDL